MCAFILFWLSCVDVGHAVGWSLNQGFLPAVYQQDLETWESRGAGLHWDGIIVALEINKYIVIGKSFMCALLLLNYFRESQKYEKSGYVARMMKMKSTHLPRLGHVKNSNPGYCHIPESL
jgi:hypothetical protein